jgi:hypothetical protein
LIDANGNGAPASVDENGTEKNCCHNHDQEVTETLVLEKNIFFIPLQPFDGLKNTKCLKILVL